MNKNIISAIKKNIKLRAEKYKGIFIDWFGGEPLLEIPTILEISNYAKTIAAEENKEYYSHITTNGYFLTVGNVRDLIAAGVRHFTVTIDGTSKSHDKTRVLPDGGGTFNTIFSNITQLKETDIDFNIKFRCNLNNQNYEGIKELIYIIGNLASDDPRFSDINIRTVANYNDVLDDKQTLLDRKESGKQVYELLYEAAKLGLFDRSIAPSFLRGGSVCYAATPDVYIIGADGTIMKCSIDLRENPDNIVGNLEPDGNMVLNENKLKTWNVDLNKNKESCSKCKKWFSCMGNSCPKAYNDGYSASCPDVFEYIHESLKLLMLETEWK